MQWDSFSDDQQFNVSCIAQSKRYDTKEESDEITSALLECTNVKAINLSGNTYSVDACENIASTLKNMADLEFVNFSDMFTTRKKPDVPPALKLLVSALDNITFLDVSDNALGAPGTSSVVDLVSQPSLKVLRINNCGIGTTGALVLSNFFRNLNGVESIKLEDASHEDLREILEDDPSPAFITEKRCDDIALEVLAIGRNRLKVDGGEAISYGIPYLKNLKEFYAPSNSIPSEGLIKVLNSLKECKQLEVLDINDNTLNQEGVPVLIELVKELPNLRILKVGDCSLGDEGCLELVKTLKELNRPLEVLDLTYNELGNEGVPFLIDILNQTQTLRMLELDGSCISGSVLSTLVDVLQEHPCELGSMDDNEDDEAESEEDLEEDL